MHKKLCQSVMSLLVVVLLVPSVVASAAGELDCDAQIRKFNGLYSELKQFSTDRQFREHGFGGRVPRYKKWLERTQEFRSELTEECRTQGRQHGYYFSVSGLIWIAFALQKGTLSDTNKKVMRDFDRMNGLSRLPKD